MSNRQRNLTAQHVALIAACGEATSFAAVAKALGTHQSTITRQVDQLEALLGYPFIHRGIRGFTLTTEGAELVPHAQRLEAGLVDLSRLAAKLGAEGARSITVQVPEGLATYWITPNSLSAGVGSDLRLNLLTSDTIPDLEAGDIDLSVQYVPAGSPDWVQVTLGYLHVVPFASRDYVKKFGRPSTVEELANHRLIAQRGPHDVDDIWFNLPPGRDRDLVLDAVTMTSNSGSTQYLAVRNSLGIGGLATYAAILDTDLVPLKIGLSQRLPIFAVFQQNSRNHPSFRVVLEWLKSIFSERHHPYFAKECIVPEPYGVEPV